MAAALILNLLFTAGLMAALIYLPKLLGPKTRFEGEMGQPYETGLRPLEQAQDHMTVSYIRYAVLFVVFDVDLAFFLPWVLARERLDLSAMLAMTAFAGLVALMLAYVWRKGVLELGGSDV